MSVSRLLRRLPKILAVFAALVVTAAPSAEAGIIQITDFTGGNVGAHGGGWTWDQTNRDLLLGSNTSSDYLFQDLGVLNAKNIAGATSLSLTGSWFPAGVNGDFIVRLYNQGTPKASAFFSFGEFAGGHTISKTLNWEPNVSNTNVDQWQIIGNGNSSNAAGDIVLTNLTVSTGAVPEIDPASAGATLAMLVGALGLLERRCRRLRIGRERAASAAAA